MLCTGENTEYDMQIYVAVRMPGATEWAYHEFEMMDDTGADEMTIFYGDLVLLQNKEATATGTAPTALPIAVGAIESVLADGSRVIDYVRMVQLAVFADSNGAVMTNPGQEWDLIQTITRDGYPSDPDCGRFAGHWLRFKLYTGSAPDASSRVHFADLKEGLDPVLPVLPNPH